MDIVSPAVGRVTSRYGPRNTGIPGASRNHLGVDIGPPRPGQRGVVICSPAAGTIKTVGEEGLRGLIVRVRHSGGWESWHQHLAKSLVSPGDKVVAGDDIGIMGNTPRRMGWGIHLHLEVHPKGGPTTTDPLAFFARRGVELGKAGIKPPSSKGAGVYVVNGKVGSSNLLGRSAPRISPSNVKYRRPRGHRLHIVETVEANGRLWGVTRHGTYYAMEYLTKAR